MKKYIFGKHIFYAVAMLLLIAGCSKIENEPATANSPEQTAESPDQESWESTIVISKEGRRMAKVWAGYVALYDSKKQTILRDSVHVDFYNREGKHNSTLTARQGVVENETENLRAMGNVIVVSDSGVVLETEELLWDNEKQKIVSDVPVKFTTDRDTLVGDSFISDPELTNYEIRNARGYSKRKVPLNKQN